MAEFNRRHTDTEQQDIEEMIAAENDPKIRLQLMVMNRINLSLIANTSQLGDLSNQFERHLKTYQTNTAAFEAALNKGRGAWRVAALFLGIVQIVGISLWVDFKADFKELQIAESKDQSVHADIIARIVNLEKEVPRAKF